MRLAERIADALTMPAGGAPIVGDDGAVIPSDALTPAAVLVAITDRLRPGVLLTQRTETLRQHAGQIAFPGGRLDPGEDAVTAALREAEEEIALPRAAVEVIGTSDLYRTGTGFRITPVIGVVPPDLPLIPSETEVASVFEVPLEFLLNAGNHRQRAAMWQGRERRYVEMMWNDRRIWGATAGMIVNLARRLRWEA
ncbi:CoA pyrophosphatase [Sphingomonas endophytica]|uniref:NUDIX hydrolase n=1 Tax=Sphingomonas endophytica TaxID=869719 RepID=A0A147I1A7_9SPHN|nr:CoA pyrophosphatase [Sphingomonas endophytica]KTT71348.1 NUDIX hydrolase [Sphingomonas endophytica]